MQLLFDGTMAEYPVKPVILFLGDSITADGLYIRFMEDWLRKYRLNQEVELIPCGVPSETVSGLSETRHPFPRPCVHDRIASAIAEAKPDVVVACYGMNDGIYHPFAAERFAAYRAGMRRLSTQIREAGARVVLMTPPPFDGASMNAKLLPEEAPDFSYLTPYRDYDRVLEHYAAWLLSGDGPADAVVDLRTPLLEHIRQERGIAPGYSSGDGIHPNRSGHWIMARTLLQELFGAEPEALPDTVPDTVPGTAAASAAPSETENDN